MFSNLIIQMAGTIKYSEPLDKLDRESVFD